MSNDVIAALGRVQSRAARRSVMADRAALRLAATLLFGGVLLSLLAGYFHPGREPANNHQATFAEYAASTSWIAVHLGQFVGMAVLIAGLLVLFVALNVDSGTPGWVARFGAIAAGVALALYGVLQAVDGVALKHAVDAWVRAPAAEKAARFASAEVIRWLEWGVRSYHSLMLGIAFVLFGSVIVVTARLPRPVGYHSRCIAKLRRRTETRDGSRRHNGGA